MNSNVENLSFSIFQWWSTVNVIQNLGISSPQGPNKTAARLNYLIELIHLSEINDWFCKMTGLIQFLPRGLVSE